MGANRFSLCGFSSFGRASPCQGEGGGFEPRNPLHFILKDKLNIRLVPFLFILTNADYGVFPTTEFLKNSRRLHQSSRIVVDCRSQVSLRQLLAWSTSLRKKRRLEVFSSLTHNPLFKASFHVFWYFFEKFSLQKTGFPRKKRKACCAFEIRDYCNL